MTTAPPPALHRRSKFWFGLGAVIALLGIAANVWLWMQRLPPIHGVTVAPIVDQTAAKDQARFCEGLTLEIIDTLARSPGLRVNALDAANDAVLDSMLQRTDDRLILIARLTRPADGHRYWSKTFSRPLKDAGFLSLDVARSIARIPEGRKPFHETNLEAYQNYLSGRSRFQQQDWEAAILDFDRATEADPDCSSAWAWTAIAKAYRVESEPLRPNLVMPEAREAAEHAAALDPDSTFGHLAVGIVRLQYDWEWDAAKSELDRAQQLAPGSALVRHWLDRWNAATHRGPGPVPDLSVELQIPLYRAAWQAAQNGNPTPARQFIEDANDIRVETYVPPTAIALLALKVQNLDGLFQWLDVAYNERSPALPYIYLTPGFPAGDPRYLDLLARMKLPLSKP
jgi:TolB-like protein